MGYITVGALPTADFMTIINGLTVNFTNMSVNPANSGNVTYNWDFGDSN
ncbi:MAG: hypothetical protein R2788_08130 [Saprospiraceae bacterium]